MATRKILGNFKGNDIELCRTTNDKVSNRAIQALMDASIPFTKNCIRIPYYRREKYYGAEQLWVIMTNPHRYSQARKVIDTLESNCRRRLKLSNY
jgi:hypothetical protein